MAIDREGKMKDLLLIIGLIIYIIGVFFSVFWCICTNTEWVKDEWTQSELDMIFSFFWPIGWIVYGIIYIVKRTMNKKNGYCK